MQYFEEVSLLYEISEALNQHMDMKKSLFKVLSVLSESLNLVRGIIFLTNSETGEIRIEIAHGISEDTTRKIKYLPGEASLEGLFKKECRLLSSGSAKNRYF